MFGKIFKQKIKAITLNEQLRVLEEIGIKLKQDFTTEHLLQLYDQKDFESNPYRLLLIAMGGEVKAVDDTWEALSNTVWHFDTECIEDNGDYIRIALRLRDLAEGYLPIDNIKDCVDIEAERAWLSFTLEGKHYKLDLKVKDDWVDPELFTKITELMSLNHSAKKFAAMDLGGQDCLIICVTPLQITKLNELPDIKFTLL